jgi:hypothetical protein
MSPGGFTKALDLETTSGIAAGMIGFQKLSEAIGQTGITDAALTIGIAALAGTMLPGGGFIDGAVKGGVALGLLKVLKLIPGTQNLVSEGSVVIGARQPAARLGPPVSNISQYPSYGSRHKVTLAM